MPYACSAGDDSPVVIHLQELSDTYDEASFCAEHWVQFIASTAQALGLYDPGDVDGMPEDPTDPGFPTTTHDDPEDTDDTGPESGDGPTLPSDADPVSAEPEPAPY